MQSLCYYYFATIGYCPIYHQRNLEAHNSSAPLQCYGSEVQSSFGAQDNGVQEISL